MATIPVSTKVQAVSIAATILRFVLPPGGGLLMWGFMMGIARNFINLPWYVHVAIIFGSTVICGFLTWLYFPLATKWRLKKQGLLTIRSNLPPFEDELQESDRVWGFWYNGGDAFNEKLFRHTGKPQRLVLLDPDSRFLDYHVNLYGGELDALKSKIRETTEAAKRENVEVKHWPLPLPFTLTIFDPESLAGRIRVEFQIPRGPLGRSPSVMVYRRTDPLVFDDLLRFFRLAIGDEK